MYQDCAFAGTLPGDYLGLFASPDDTTIEGSSTQISNAARDSVLDVYHVPFDTFFVDVENITFPSSVETTNLKVKDGSNPLIAVESSVVPLCIGFSKSFRT